MPKKLTYEEVKAYIEVESQSGCKLMSQKYINSKTKLNIQCKCGEEFETIFNSFLSQGKNKCASCSKKITKEERLLTYDYVKQFIENNKNYKLLSTDYKGNKHKLKIQCPEQHEYEVAFSHFQQGKRCPKCRGMYVTTEGFKKTIFELVGKEYTIISEYNKAHSPIQIKHESCGNIYLTTPSNFIQGNRCPVCNEKKLKTNFEFLKEVEHLVGDEYVFLEEYKNSRHKIKIKHNKCGYVWSIQPSSFLKRGTRCPKCQQIKTTQLQTKTQDEFNKKVYELVGDEYIFLEPYEKGQQKILVRHNVCGYEYTVRPVMFTNHENRCPKCMQKMKKDTNYFKQEVFDLVQNEYIVTGEYSGSNRKIEIQHSECGKKYRVRPIAFIRGNRCPFCCDRRNSRGAKRIDSYMSRNVLRYEREWKTDNCKNKKALPFDFAILNSRNMIECLIEFDGEQHYRPVNMWKGESGFKRQQLNDQIKNRYCEEKRIPLLRIPYWEINNVEALLEEFLQGLGLLEGSNNT